ncbi:septum formation protein Maf [Anaerofilum sp. BX8]|uniref:dTTP/UTP pyrophosphatase n=1 Tax=Anaerofilum hominis TaxID=2763016 RepID=A0A923IF76_9FIRM|nr:Maf family protein [Anaerofilum hominis]MBC5581672.1 septum formation protein Maf [Anaerofilum hominis]
MLILASGSPRRRELLQLITPDFEVAPSEIDERAVSAPTPRALVAALAEAKARAAAARPGDVVLGCDTVVDLDGRVLGKPADRAGAEAMLRAYSGRWHYVHTGVCALKDGLAHGFVETSKVFFAPLEEDEIAAYAATGEPYDKAGAYAIQGGAARFVTRVEGCYFNVMGLPVSSLYQLLRRLDALG